MTDYWEPTAMLLHRPERTLNADEQASVRSLLAFIDVMDGLRSRAPDHRWARSADRAASGARALGRMPTGDDGLLSRRDLDWVTAQRTAALNSFQRACLEAIPGWTW